MDNKKSRQQLRLKTVDITQLFHKKQDYGAISGSQGFLRHKTQGPKLVSAINLAKRQIAAMQKVERILREGFQPPRTHTKNFPRRQKAIKNGNPYRYFLTQKTERPEPMSPEHSPLRISFATILSEKLSQRVRSHSIASRNSMDINQNEPKPRRSSIQRLEDPRKCTIEPWDSGEREGQAGHFFGLPA